MTKPAPDSLRIAVAQLNPVVGDVAGNLEKARAARAQAARAGADLVLFTELFIAGYPPEDLVLKPAFVAACERALEALAADTQDGGPGVVIGTPLRRKAACTIRWSFSTPAGSSPSATSSTCPITASSTRSAFSSRDRTCRGR